MATTLMMSTIVEDKNFRLFDFPYNLYDNSLKLYFEEKFIKHFMLYEIGFETVGAFKQQLEMTLNEIYPYYRQLYETEIRCKSIDFMLNKDLKETYIRELTNEGSSNTTSTQEMNSTSSSDNLSTTHATPQNRVDDLDKYMNGASKDKSSSNGTSTGNENVDSSSKGSSTEKYELISQGNIGVTSSAELLDKWRSVIINIDQMIFEDCKTLFLLVY